MAELQDPQDLIRELLVRELETVNVYTEMLASARTPEVRALIAEVTAQEKHHIAEAADMLARYDTGQAAALARAGIAIAREEPAKTAETAETVLAAYEPSGVTAAVESGETLLAAGMRSGVDIRHDCGGKGVCGTCRVEMLAGGDALSTVTDPERKHLGELLDDGWRLACQTTPRAPVRLRVPPNEKGKQKKGDDE